MLRLVRLETSPKLFSPVAFHDGVNIVMGEKWDEEAAQGRKTNGVGKSLFVDFLHFALLRKFNETRLSRLPEEGFPGDFEVKLSLRIHDRPISVIRSKSNPDTPIILHEGEETVFSTLDEANGFLGELLFAGQSHAGQLSFRSLMSLLMRDERSEFADVLRPHRSSSNIPPELEPHLYLMGIDLTPYRELRSSIDRLDGTKKALKSIKEDLTERGEKSLRDLPKELNAEKESVSRIDEALKTLEAEPAFAERESDLVQLETRLRDLRVERKKIAHRINQIESIPAPERIQTDDLAILYNRVKQGLGDLVEKSLEQAIAFKKQIESFQNRLRDEDYHRLKRDYDELNSKIRDLSKRHAEIVGQIDRQGVLAELQTGLIEAAKRRNDFFRREGLLRHYREKESEKEELDAERLRAVVELRKLLDSYATLQESLNKTFVAIHKRVMETSGASLSLQIMEGAQRKYPLEIRAEVDDGGSHGVDHMAVFIYDCTLLFNEITKRHHPGFLLHDNIFNVDNDSTVQALNFLHEMSEGGESFQYVLTLNRDKLESEERRKAIKLDLDEAKVLTLTKNAPLLGKRYRQKREK